MNIWENGVITNKGMALQAKLIEGHSLKITRAVTGGGFVTPGLLQQQTAVLGEMQELTFSPVSYPEQGKCKLPCSLTNDELETGYTAMQVGIYAEDPDEGEILYFLTQAEISTGTIIPSKTEMPGYNAEWIFYFQYGQADGVVVTIDPASLENKADRDFGNVTNVHFLQKAIISGAAIPIVTTGGNSENYTAEVPGMTELKEGMTFIMIPHVTSSTTTPTLNVNRLGKLGLRQQLHVNFAATVAGAIPTWVSKGKPALVTYDGDLWKVNIAMPSAGYLYGLVPIDKGGTEADNPEDARDNLGAASKEDVEDLKLQIELLKGSMNTEVTGNYHEIKFDTLDGLIVTGIWNEAKARMEC